MSTQRKTNKSFFSKLRKRGKIADGLSTTFFELKLNSNPSVSQPVSSKPEQAPVAEACKKTKSDHINMEAPLHLINVIV
jgi:hypothetical protein